MTKKRQKFGAIPTLNTPRKSFEKVPTTPRPARLVVKEHPEILRADNVMWDSARERIGTSFVSIVHKWFAKLIRKIMFQSLCRWYQCLRFCKGFKITRTLNELRTSKNKKTRCDITKLSINMAKTNFMIIKSARKRDMEISRNISNSDGSSHVLERKQCIKYLGVMIDESLTWKHHIAFVCSRISRNSGIIYLFSN